jgi:uncharacterized protein
MNWRKINRVLHRDFGYFFFGMCIIYGLSGIALNHRHDWNPNYIITQKEVKVNLPEKSERLDRYAVKDILKEIGEDSYKTHITSTNNLRIFIDGGSVNINLTTGEGNLEKIRRRPVFYEVNFLHYNTPRKLWTWFSDIYAGALILISITGLFILKGKNGITRRGAWLTGAGIIIPLILLYVYL